MLPAMRDMHIHWIKPSTAARGAPEPSGGHHHSGHDPPGQKLLPELQPYTQERAEKLIDLIQSKGSTIARSHCNIEPVSGLKNWKICRRYWRAGAQALTAKSLPSRSTACCCRILKS